MTTTGFVINILNSMIKPNKNEQLYDKLKSYNELNDMKNIMMFKDDELTQLVIYWIDNIKEDYGQTNGGIGKYLDWVCENITIKFVNLYKKGRHEDAMKLMKKNNIFNINRFWILDTTLDINDYTRMHYLIYKYIK